MSSALAPLDGVEGVLKRQIRVVAERLQPHIDLTLCRNPVNPKRHVAEGKSHRGAVLALHRRPTLSR